MERSGPPYRKGQRMELTVRPGPQGLETLEQSENTGLGDSDWGKEASRGFRWGI